MPHQSSWTTSRLSDIVVVMPCYNEALRLDSGRLLKFAGGASGVRFVLVNDGSTDGTGELLHHLRRAAPDRFQVCDLPQNRGKGEAVRCGMLEAFRSRPAYVAFWDADLATPLEEIQRFHQVLQRRPEVQAVLASRRALPGHRIRRSRWRRLLGRTFAIAASRVLGFSIYDTQCGAKMFRVSPQTEALFGEPFLSRWIFDVEILARLACRQQGHT